MTDPDLLQARQEAIEKARRRMQEEHDKQAVVYAQRMKEVSLMHLNFQRNKWRNIAGNIRQASYLS